MGNNSFVSVFREDAGLWCIRESGGSHCIWTLQSRFSHDGGCENAQM